MVLLQFRGEEGPRQGET